jgi:hypothetical protein
MRVGWGNGAEQPAGHWVSACELFDRSGLLHTINQSHLQTAILAAVWCKATPKHGTHGGEGKQQGGHRSTAAFIEAVRTTAAASTPQDFRHHGIRNRTALLSAYTLPYTELAATPSAQSEAHRLALALSRAVLNATPSITLKQKLLLEPDDGGLSPLLAVLGSGSTKLTQDYFANVRILNLPEHTRQEWLTHRTLDGFGAMHAVRCAFSDRIFHSRMPSDPTHSSRRFTPLTT